MVKVIDVLETQAIGMPIGEAVKLLNQIIGIESDTIKRLDRIEAKVDRLLGTPYKAAIEYVESASIRGLNDYERQRRLDRTHDCLIKAVAAAGPDLTTRTAAEVALASLHYLRHEYEDAEHYAVRAYRTSVDAVAEAVDRANVLKIGRLPEISREWRASDWYSGAISFANDFFPGERKRRICLELRNRSDEVREIGIYLGAAAKDLARMKLWLDRISKILYWRPIEEFTRHRFIIEP